VREGGKAWNVLKNFAILWTHRPARLGRREQPTI
jgi:hypothetical protein